MSLWLRLFNPIEQKNNFRNWEKLATYVKIRWCNVMHFWFHFLIIFLRTWWKIVKNIFTISYEWFAGLMQMFFFDLLVIGLRLENILFVFWGELKYHNLQLEDSQSMKLLCIQKQILHCPPLRTTSRAFQERLLSVKNCEIILIFFDEKGEIYQCIIWTFRKSKKHLNHWI